MWRWLLAKLPKRTTIFGSLWLISGSVHGLILLIALLLAHIDSRQSLVVTTGARRSSDARIVLLPMLKTVRGTQYDQPVRGTQFGVAATKKPSKPQQKKSSQSKKAQVEKQKEPTIKKSVKSIDKKVGSTMLAGAEKESSKPLIPSESRSDLYRGTDKKKTDKGAKKDVKTVAKKLDTKSQVVKKSIEEKKSLVAQTNPKEIKSPLIPSESLSDLDRGMEEQNLLGDPNAIQDVIYVGRDDLRSMQVQHVVSDALQKNWRPPSGIAKDTYCQISFDIDKEGKACNIVMQQHSKVLIFDVAARTALLQAHFNPAAEGQKFTVAFKP